MMAARDCPDDLLARAGRNAISAEERAQLKEHLRWCADCRVARMTAMTLEPDLAIQSGDDARVAALVEGIVGRVVRASNPMVSRRFRPARRPAWKRALPFAAGLVLAAAVAAAAVSISRRAGRPALRGAQPSVAVAPRPTAPPTPPTPAPIAIADTASTAGSRRSSAIPPRAGTRPASAPSPVTAGKLFEQAGESRRAGDSVAAIARYRRLQRAFPDSSEAELSYISLGKLLADQGAARAALAEFEAYLERQPRGALSAEAWFGCGRARTAIGDAEGARAAWQTLLAQFPTSPYAAWARRRLDGGAR